MELPAARFWGLDSSERGNVSKSTRDIKTNIRNGTRRKLSAVIATGCYPRVMAASDESDTHQRERVGLCADCAHSRRVEAKRGALFFLCGLSVTDPEFPKYPSLPVLHCSGYTVSD
jgi:hypothetical protein